MTDQPSNPEKQNETPEAEVIEETDAENQALRQQLAQYKDIDESEE